VIVITGASSGIGLVTARMAAEQGARVLLVARNAAALADAVSAIRSAGGVADHAVADVGDAAQLSLAAEKALACYGRIDAWVNCAGVAIYAPLLDTPHDEHHRLFRTNYFGTVHGCRIAVAHLRDRGGALITVGSITSELPTPIMGAYAASKHAAKAYVDGLRMEVMAAGLPISVTLIKPSGIDTPIARHAANHVEGEARIPPVVYDPALVARAILDAAVHPRREMTVGGVGRAQVLFGLHFPAMFDRLSRFMIPILSNPAVPKTLGDNLFAPMPDGSPRGAQPGRKTSGYTAAERHSTATALGSLALLAAGAALLARRRVGQTGAASHWTDTDLDLLHSLNEGGATQEQMARRLGRPVSEIHRVLPTVQSRPDRIPVQTADHGANAWFGADEEGDVPPPTGRPLNDTAAWVHT
jgi:short-subunit dehydrogenase